jgi:hypothetical protein
MGWRIAKELKRVVDVCGKECVWENGDVEGMGK